MSNKRRIANLNPINVLSFFVKEERRSSGLLLLAAVLALIIANTQWSSIYLDFLHYELRFGFIELDLKHWINEGLMAVFFLAVGLEVKRELIDGELNTWKKAAFPVYSAIGGMLIPALVFALFNPTAPQNAGWGIPMATDIAIAVGLLGILGRLVHRSLRVYLLSLAIIDDIGSIIVIGLFYSQPTNTILLLLAVILGMSLLVLRRLTLWPLYFLLIGIGLWLCLVESGITGTLAGVVLALAMPMNKRRHNSKHLLPAETIEDVLIPITSFVVVPLFVFANAGVDFGNIGSVVNHSLLVFWGVFLGLLIGKPLGIAMAARLAVTLRLAHKPVNISWTSLIGVGFIAGVGFTISLLMTNLAYESALSFRQAATYGIFAASVLAGVTGTLILGKSLRSPKNN